jgi:hypothetical protein
VDILADVVTALPYHGQSGLDTYMVLGQNFMSTLVAHSYFISVHVTPTQDVCPDHHDGHVGLVVRQGDGQVPPQVQRKRLKIF